MPESSVLVTWGGDTNRICLIPGLKFLAATSKLAAPRPISKVLRLKLAFRSFVPSIIISTSSG